MYHFYTDKQTDHSIPIILTTISEFNSWLTEQTPAIKNWLQSCQFEAKPSNFCLIPNNNGELSKVLLCLADEHDFWSVGALPPKLPAGIYYLESHFLNNKLLERMVIAWGLGNYSFNRYRQFFDSKAQLLLPENSDVNFCQEWVTSVYLVRDLINIPTEEMGPEQLAQAVMETGKAFSAKTKVIIGEKLLAENYPTIYAVGRSSSRPPRLIDLRWGESKNPKVTLVGKGVCFDSGGLCLKSREGMLGMKKDMAGGAHALGLARMIMARQLPVCLRVLIPAVENTVSGNSYRPGDVIRTRGGISVEVTNTDAEGRLVLCDALAEAVTEQPQQLFDFSTLTGAARVALGPQIPAMFSNNDTLADELLTIGKNEQDMMWRLPLYSPYLEYLQSNIADITNAAEVGYAGAITAALYLQKFVKPSVPWVHFDMLAWNNSYLPGRPIGGEAVTLRAVFSYLQQKYS